MPGFSDQIKNSTTWTSSSSSSSSSSFLNGNGDTSEATYCLAGKDMCELSDVVLLK
jgi:hypothetical protein